MRARQKCKTPVNLFPLLELATQPGARLILVDGKAFILSGKTHKYVRPAIYNALLEEDWITRPRQIAPDLAESSITGAGYAQLAAIKARRRKYTQLMFSL